MKISKAAIEKACDIVSTGDHDEDFARTIPQPKGWRMLIYVPEPEGKLGSVMTSETRTTEEHLACPVGLVIAMGDLCYRHPKFGNEYNPWCKVGDWITTKSYAGTRLKVNGQEFRTINDETVETVVEDPRGIERA